MLTLLLLLFSCGREVECRDPLVSVYMDRGYGSCTVIWDRCEDDHSYTATCDNSTYEGDWGCLCVSTDVGFGPQDYQFSSEDFCEADAEEMTAQVSQACGWDLVLTE